MRLFPFDVVLQRRFFSYNNLSKIYEVMISYASLKIQYVQQFVKIKKNIK